MYILYSGMLEYDMRNPKSKLVSQAKPLSVLLVSFIAIIEFYLHGIISNHGA